MYAPPSKRGQWQSNAYNIFVPRSQSYMTERARKRILMAPNKLEVHYQTDPHDSDTMLQTYS
jgi:hypothetical protein